MDFTLATVFSFLILGIVQPPAACDSVCLERRALEEACALVPLDADVRTKIIDPEFASDPVALRHLDAFIVREANGTLRRVIYINRESAILRQAATGSEFHVLVLAAVIHHESRHLAGASEPEARRAEREFLHSLVARTRVRCSLVNRSAVQRSDRSGLPDEPGCLRLRPQLR